MHKPFFQKFKDRGGPIEFPLKIIKNGNGVKLMRIWKVPLSSGNFEHFAETEHVNLGDKKDAEDLEDKEGLHNDKMETPQSTKHFATECGDCKAFGVYAIKMEGSSLPEVL